MLSLGMWDGIFFFFFGFVWNNWAVVGMVVISLMGSFCCFWGSCLQQGAMRIYCRHTNNMMQNNFNWYKLGLHMAEAFLFLVIWGCFSTYLFISLQYRLGSFWVCICQKQFCKVQYYSVASFSILICLSENSFCDWVLRSFYFWYKPTILHSLEVLTASFWALLFDSEDSEIVLFTMVGFDLGSFRFRWCMSDKIIQN